MKKIPILYCLVFLIGSLSKGQSSRLHYDEDFLKADFYKGRRNAVRELMPDSSVAVIFAAPERNRANDVDYYYHQNPDFYYLTGFTQPNAMLLILKRPFYFGEDSVNEILFVAARNSEAETWTGRMATTEEAQSISGIDTVLLSFGFSGFPRNASTFSTVLYMNLPKGVVNDKSDTCDLFDLVEQFKTKFSFPPANGDSFLLGSYLKKLREVKQHEEIRLMRKAISISCAGHKEMMKVLKPGMTEYQVQAAGEFVFKTLGAASLGYNSICGSGENSCILHYETNRKKTNAGELILLDMGAEYHGYTADVTRTLPVNGKFSKNQRALYNIVLAARDSAFKRCIPGNEFRDPHRAALEVLKNGLLSLGITNNEEDVANYFMHGTSHYLGLDVHDAGTFTALKPGNVITVEPGIYIPSGSPCSSEWWNTGIRIEDDVLITENGYEVLSNCVPSTAEEVEALMKLPGEYLK